MPGKETRIDQSARYGREASGENAHRHRRNLADHGSCKVPKGQTITLEEWRDQQEENAHGAP